MDSSMTLLRTDIRATDCGVERPSDLRRETNLSVSKWCSLGRGGVVEKAAEDGGEEGEKARRAGW